MISYSLLTLKKKQNGPNLAGLGWSRISPKYAFPAKKRKREEKTTRFQLAHADRLAPCTRTGEQGRTGDSDEQAGVDAGDGGAEDQRRRRGGHRARWEGPGVPGCGVIAVVSAGAGHGGLPRGDGAGRGHAAGGDGASTHHRARCRVPCGREAAELAPAVVLDFGHESSKGSRELDRFWWN